MIPAILGLAGPALTPDERALLRAANPAGIILFGRNIVDRDQLRALTGALRDVTGRAVLPILVDQEGGRVARLGPPHWPAFPAPARFGETYERAPVTAIAAARANAAAIALTLADVGISWAAAPVLDLAHPGTHAAIGDRSFGPLPLAAAALGRAMLSGLADGGVAGVIKHMPGQGRAEADSHLSLPAIEADEAALAQDFAPFAALANRARIGMTTHALFTAIDPHRPATLSPPIVAEIIRGRIGFDGLLLSDDIEMGALAGPVPDRAAAALAAGCDLVLHCSGDLPAMAAMADRIADAMTPAATARLDRACEPHPQPTDEPLAALIARRDALLAAAAA